MPNLCEECGGACCKQIPGALHPDEYDALPDADKLFYDLSVTGIMRPILGNDGHCIFLDKKGCVLDLELRPKQCRELEPLELFDRIQNKGCKQGYTKRQALLDWLAWEERNKEAK